MATPSPMVAKRRAARRPGTPAPAVVQPSAHAGLLRRDGRLVFDDLDLDAAARVAGSPVLVYSRPRLALNAAAALAALQPLGQVYFSCKACTLRGVIASLHAAGLGVEVASRFEFELARRAGVPDAHVRWTSVGLCPEDLAVLQAHTPGTLVLNSAADGPRVAAARAGQQRLNVALRVQPADIAGDYEVRGSRLGTSVEDGSALQAVRVLLAQPGLHLTGIAAHAQARATHPAGHVSLLRALQAFALQVHEATGYRIHELSIGGGWASAGEVARAAGLAAFGQELAARLRAFPWPLRLTCEPGRLLVEDAGLVLTRVLGLAAASGRRWYVVDAGTHFLMPFERRFEALPLHAGQTPGNDALLGDRLSSFTGVLTEGVSLPSDLAPGDLLALPAAGAYTWSTAQQFMFGLPAVMLGAPDGWELLVAAESAATWADRVGGTYSPEWVRAAQRGGSSAP